MKQNKAPRRQRKREKMIVGKGPRDFRAVYETKICGELRVRCRWLCASGEGGAEHERIKAGVANGTGPTQDIKKDGKSKTKGVKN